MRCLFIFEKESKKAEVGSEFNIVHMNGGCGLTRQGDRLEGGMDAHINSLSVRALNQVDLTGHRQVPAPGLRLGSKTRSLPWSGFLYHLQY